MHKTLSIVIGVIVTSLIAGGAWWYLSQSADFGIDVTSDQALVDTTDQLLTEQMADDESADMAQNILSELDSDDGIATSEAFELSGLADEEATIDTLDESITAQTSDDTTATNTTSSLTEAGN